ncbi:MAG: hypothetical protein EPN97_16195 [Alphaproteobacteria bacterium]|nr:MAG: hypothetical protein EPN97_16195 [Alphaproteobacteria bacterium]
MPALRKSLMLAAMAGLVLLACVSDTSASTVAVQANISFDRVIAAHKKSDITFGGLNARPNDQVSLGADGTMRLLGNGEVLSPFGHPSVITLGDTRDYVMNFVPGNYVPGQGISSLKARCVVKGTDHATCDSTPLYGQKESTLFIGMDMTLSDSPAVVDNAAPPSFDMSVIYQ